MTAWRLVADVGGTNVRFAQVIDGALRNVSASPTSEYRDFYEAMDAYIAKSTDRASCAGAAIGAAGPVDHGVVKLTNGAWTIDAGAVSAQLGARPVRVLNDLEAIAYCAPLLSAGDLSAIADRAGPPDAPKLVVNVGTGFGAAIAVPTPAGWTPVACEPGHMKLALLQHVAQRFAIDAPTIEEVISGQALQTVWNTGTPQISTQFDDEFSKLFGQVCGDLVLATGSWGGVLLFGSVAKAWREQGEFASFLAAFENKGPMTRRMQTVPIHHIIDGLAALRGLALSPLP